MEKKHILFLLPEYYENPIGGYKVVFEYANRLVKDQYQVSIVYPSFLVFRPSSMKRKFKMIFFYFFHLIFKRHGVTSWFPLDSRVKNLFVFSLAEKNIPKADFYFATAMETAQHLDSYKKIELNQKYYLIQALEDWQWGRVAALNTWKLPLNKIVVSPWLKSLAEELGVKVDVIENGVDRIGLNYSINIKERNKYTVMMLYHKQKLKGCNDGLEALQIVKKRFPNLQSVWFGCPARPKGLPEWIEYHQMPSDEMLNSLYNKCSIFLGTSHSEGFGLTVGEAMSCGCSVVCTNAGGYLTMAKHKETALVCEIGDIDDMALKIITLLENDELRFLLASKGNEFIQQFTWDHAYQKFKTLIN
jgi:glycosyltransferase involved in cell wall biosynthesis